MNMRAKKGILIMMEYEVVTMEEKKVVGLAARTNNMSSDMGNVIGGLWNDFYGKGVYQAIGHKADQKALGIYKDYAGDHRDDYTVMVACTVTEAEKTKDAPVPVVSTVIPAGKYARFIVKGDCKTAVGEFWQKLWSMDLPRSFQCDYEEYQNDDCEHAEVHIYIGLKG